LRCSAVSSTATRCPRCTSQRPPSMAGVCASLQQQCNRTQHTNDHAACQGMTRAIMAHKRTREWQVQATIWFIDEGNRQGRAGGFASSSHLTVNSTREELASI
jgi:hypothetical protein